MKSVNYILISLGIFASVFISIHAAQPWGDNYAYQDISGYLSLLFFELWICLPFLVLFLQNKIYKNSNTHLKFLTLICLFIVISSTYIYIESIFYSSSSTSSLIFLFLPVYQLIFLTITFGVCVVISKTLNKASKKDALQRTSSWGVMFTELWSSFLRPSLV